MQKQNLLKISGVDKAFPGVKALNNACLSVYTGRVMALMGENGAGKSTLMKVLTGIYSKDCGTIEYLGREVSFKDPKHSQEAGISIIHQELNLVGNLTIAENIFSDENLPLLGARLTGTKCMPKQINCLFV